MKERENNMNILENKVQYLKGVGETRAKKLEKLGIETVEDLVTHFPRSYEDRRNVKKIKDFKHGENVVFKARVVSRVFTRRIRKSLGIVYFFVSDGDGEVRITLFNQMYVVDKIKLDSEYAFYGKVEYVNGGYEVQNPVIVQEEKLDTLCGIYPLYRLTNGITNNYIYTLEKEVLDSNIIFEEVLPEYILNKYKLEGLDSAIRNIHMPQNMKVIDVARRRIIFEELFCLQLALNSIKLKNHENHKGILFEDVDYLPFIKLLPFTLTSAQMRAINEITEDMKNGKLMNRLVQGDVGSGKTMVAAVSLYLAAKNGFQGALMAPTTILALQHKKELEKYLGALGFKVEAITGNTTAKQKRLILEDLKEGKIDVLVGTHAMLEDNVEFKNLGLIVTDEQHRFGVKQRMKLSNKGSNPDVIVMSATPIPRTLALMLYSDLDMSIIDELPPNRKPVKTYVVDESYEERLNNFIRKQIEEGHQVYIVCPLIEENEELDLKAATTIYEKFRDDTFKENNVGFLNGKQKNKEKDAVMQEFKAGNIDILVSTTVIEVGVDVPNATLMVIESAERFGLAALHQLRGRVGRSSLESYCVLVSKSKSLDTKARLDIMAKSNDGFEIAQKDLELRGPGDFFGTRQHGLPVFKLADLLKDVKILKEATDAAKEVLNADPSLEGAENKLLKKYIFEKYAEQLKNLGT